MENDFLNHPDFSPRYKIIGIGENSRPILNEIAKWGFQGIKIEMFDECHTLPDDGEEMVIFINPENNDAYSAYKSFYEANILTLIIATHGFKEKASFYDAVSITDNKFIIQTILGLLYPLFHIGIIGFDFYDIYQLLKNQGRFKILYSLNNDAHNNINLIIENILKSYKHWDSIERVAFIFSYNRMSDPSLSINDFVSLKSILNQFSDSINCTWGMIDDNSLKNDTFQIIGILSGKELKF